MNDLGAFPENDLENLNARSPPKCCRNPLFVSQGCPGLCIKLCLTFIASAEIKAVKWIA